MHAPPQTPSEFKASLQSRKGFWLRRLNMDAMIKYFFGGNALMSVIVLVLITVFLFKEGIGFLDQSWRNLKIYRLAGLEYVDILRGQTEAFTKLTRELNEIRLLQFKLLVTQGMQPEQANQALVEFDGFASQFGSAGSDLQGLVSDLTEMASAIKEKAKDEEGREQKRAMLIAAGKTGEAGRVEVGEIDFAAEVKPLREAAETHKQITLALSDELLRLMQRLPALPSKQLEPRVQRFQRHVSAYLYGLGNISQELKAWNQFEPVPRYRAVTSFLFGLEWLTASFWQDWYGIVPLFVGSLLVSAVALAIAVPAGVCAAIYVNEVAGAREQHVIKPCIEFISAIPSVVLGFFGIAVLGQLLRTISQGSLHWIPLINWDVAPFLQVEHAFAWCVSCIPGFPFSERLNVFTAGCLLALMAVPTIFSLSEDALNNVPRSLKESSYALGATRLQTILRVLVPAALSGIISAVLLGFGRVIGETMVVLLCAGNRIAIPDFTQGLGVFFQPVHTMTGIIAQEMGEVDRGSIHYRALFMIGIVLFFLTLLINFLAQRIVKKYRISIG